MEAETYIAIIVAVSSLLASLVSAWKQRQDAAQAARKSALDELAALVDNLQEEVRRLRTERDECGNRIDALRGEVEALRVGVSVLIEQIVQAGLEPRWKPGTGPLVSRDTTIERRL